ncbi:Suppression of tumorigenicity [Entamoeba marina]
MDYLNHPNSHLNAGGLFDYISGFLYWDINNIEIIYKIAKDTNLDKAVLPFCFPEEEGVTFNDTDVFSFTLTGVDGHRKVGYCKRSTSDKPFQCICVISDHASFPLFSSIADTLWNHFTSDVPSFIQICDDLYQHRFPFPGESVHSSNSLKCSSYNFTRPLTKNVYANGSIKLLRNLGVSNVLFIISHLLTERKFIFVGDKLSDISTTVRCLLELIQPFVWEHVYIPILPKRMSSYGAAPMPYIIGCLRSLYPQVVADSYDIDDVFVVDVTTGIYINRPDFPPLLNSSRFVRLVNSLNRLLDNSACTNENQISSGYEHYFYSKKDKKTQVAEFNWKKFLQKSDEGDIIFLETFKSSQMCFMFLDERERILREGKDIHEYCPFLMQSFENIHELECSYLSNVSPNEIEPTSNICCNCQLEILPTQPVSIVDGNVCHTVCNRCVSCLILNEGNPITPTGQLITNNFFEYKSPQKSTKYDPIKKFTALHKEIRNRKKCDTQEEILSISEPVPDLKTFTKYLGSPDVEMLVQHENTFNSNKEMLTKTNTPLDTVKQPTEILSFGNRASVYDSSQHQPNSPTKDEKPTTPIISRNTTSVYENKFILSPSALPSKFASTKQSKELPPPNKPPPPPPKPAHHEKECHKVLSLSLSNDQRKHSILQLNKSQNSTSVPQQPKKPPPPIAKKDSRYVLPPGFNSKAFQSKPPPSISLTGAFSANPVMPKKKGRLQDSFHNKLFVSDGDKESIIDVGSMVTKSSPSTPTTLTPPVEIIPENKTITPQPISSTIPNERPQRIQSISFLNRSSQTGTPCSYSSYQTPSVGSATQFNKRNSSRFESTETYPLPRSQRVNSVHFKPKMKQTTDNFDFTTNDITFVAATPTPIKDDNKHVPVKKFLSTRSQSHFIQPPKTSTQQQNSNVS